MSKHIHHDFQWSHTENAIYMFHKILEKNIDNRSNLEELFFKTAVCATEKLDGTNVAKDESGQIYGRRMPISKDTKVYQKTSLEAVRSADIEKVKTTILKLVNLERNSIKKFILYGELICNHFYDYDKRDLHGKWMVFGARITGEDKEKIYDKLSQGGFCVKRKKDCVLILSNSTFLDIVKTCGMDIPNMIADKKSVFDIVEENKEDVVCGKLEGIVLTWSSSQYGGQIVKWKGPHEPQPNAVKEIGNALKIIEEENIQGDLRKIFHTLKEISDAGSEIKKKRKSKQSKQREIEEKEKTEKQSFLRQISAADKKLIVDGVYHSMKKFDDIETYKEADAGIENYINILEDEVGKHWTEEKKIDEENLGENIPILEFIKH